MSSHQMRLVSKKALFCLTAAAVLHGCGGTGQDTGAPSSTPQPIQGLVIDGYLARALVFLDYDNNSTRDPWEPFAFTDDDGYYSFNPHTDTDYCAADASPDLQLHCLKSSRNLANTVIRVDGGYDVSTGEPFYGQMSRRIQTNSDGINNLVISPLTTILTHAKSESEKTAILSALGVNSADLDIDYFNADNSSNIDSALLNTALKLHKTVSVMNHFISAHYDEIGNHSGSANDLTSFLYRHLAHELISRAIDINTLLSDAQAMGNILSRAENDARNIYDQWEMFLPVAGLSFNPVIEQSRQIGQLIDQLIPQDDPAINQEQVNGIAKLIETITLKAMREPLNNGTFNGAISFLQSAENQYLVSELLSSLTSDTADVNGLANRNFASEEFRDPETIRSIAQLPSNTGAFERIAGKQLRVSDMDLGHAPNRLKDSEVEFYFHGQDNDMRGRFDACVKYIEDATSDGKLGEANTRGELVTGYWSLLGAERNNGTSYSLLLTIRFLGSTYQAILKPAGFATFNEIEMSAVRFDYAGELRTWHSADGFEPMGDVPIKNTDCVTRLPSRIGI